MKIKYAIESVYESVFLVNGIFKERINNVDYPKMSPLYITTLPLSALLLPYTIRLVNGKSTCNSNLVSIYEVADGRFIVKLKERHNYVYSPESIQKLPPESGVASVFYRTVKAGEFEKARRMMTKELSSSINDDALASFFAPYVDVVENRFDDLPGEVFFINGETGRSEPFHFEFSGEKISNIEES